MYDTLENLRINVCENMEAIQKAVSIFLSDTEKYKFLIEDILMQISDISNYLYSNPEIMSVISSQMDEMKENNFKFIRFVEEWMSSTQQELKIRFECSNKLDYDFHCFIQHIKYSSEDALKEEIVTGFRLIKEKSLETYQNMINYLNHFSYFWGKIDIDCGVFDLVNMRVEALKNHWEDFVWLYSHLADYRSKKVLYGIISFWLNMDFAFKNSLIENNWSDYFDLDILSCDKGEVFVDCGAYTGDSVMEYIKTYGKYNKIYLYEMTPESMNEARKNLATYHDIIYRECGVGKVSGVLNMSRAGDNWDSSNHFSESGSIPVPIVTIDEDIAEPVTLIKMDIEGSEMDALKGAINHIKSDHPKLAICTYHNYHHIYEVPRFIYECSPDYRFYMRYNGPKGHFMTTEFVTFAV